MIKILLFAIPVMVFSMTSATPKPTPKDFYQIKVYGLSTNEQVAHVDDFLQHAYLPALHRQGISDIGVFKNIGIDTAAQKKIFVWISMHSLEQLSMLEDALDSDAAYQKNAYTYLTASYTAPAYDRFETIVLRAFDKLPHFKKPALAGEISQRVYELRSYEASSETYYKKKVEMFNAGGEVALFARLKFNAVFYAEVLAGSHMPNLMYMTSFDNMQSRDAHWKTFGDDPEWKKLSALPEYQHTVSKADILLLFPAPYSEI